MAARRRHPRLVTARSWRLLVSVAAATLVAAGPVWPAAASAAEFESRRQPDSRIERPMADLHLLAPAAGSEVPRLLVIDAGRPTPGAVRMAVLERDRSWSETAVLEVALRPAENGAVRPVWALDAPWILPIDAGSVAVLANATVEDAAYLTRVTVERDGAGRDTIVQGARLRIPFQVDDAGVADIDGDGQPSLLVASARTERAGGTCQGTTILALDPVSLATRATLELSGVRVAGAVIGRFDPTPGDDLFAYAYPNCPAGPDTAVEARAMAIRLRDGATLLDRRAATVAGFLGTPLRLDAEGGGHAVVARLADGLALLEPGDGWRTTVVGPPASRPLSAVARPDGPFVTWLETRPGEEAIMTASISDGGVHGGAYPRDGDIDRWQQLQDSLDENVRTGTPPVAFHGDVAGVGCTVLFVPGAIVPCGETTPGSGAAWTATRPLTIFDDGRSRRLLVASGVGWQEGRLPGVPAPAATDVAGWWRHGPSVPFVLAEARAADATYFRTFPVPTATVERVSGPAGTVDLPGFTGTRLLVRVQAAAPDASDAPVLSREQILSALPADDEHVVVTRVEVPPGVETGRDGSFVRVELGADLPSEGPWLVSVVPINDWGELGRSGVGIVRPDTRPPLLEMAAPFTSPLWPAQAELSGVAEPRTTVLVDGVGPLELDRRGRFVIREALLPWPRTFRLTATDASGNVTTLDVTVVGGIDYRQFPIELLLAAALIVAAVVSGVSSTRRRRQEVGPALAPDARRWQDDGPGPEIEDLPAGTSGLGRH